MQNKLRLSSLSLGLIATSLLLASTTVMAASYKGEAGYKGEAMMPAPCPQPKILHDGFYVGIGTGYDNYSTRNSYSARSATVGLSGNPVTAQDGWLGQIFVGYGQYFNNMYYLGGELFAIDSTAQSSNTHNTKVAGVLSTAVNSKFTVNTSYGISVLPGLKVNDSTLAYVRLGYEWANLKGKGSLTAHGVTDSFSKSNTQGGFNYGIGLETAVYQNFSVRGEVNHTSYNSFTPSNAIGSVKFSPSDTQVLVNLSYHFA